MTDFDYKNYSLENLENWLHDALSSAEASPHEIYSTIRKVVQDEYNYHKEQSQKCFGLLELMSGHRPVDLSATGVTFVCDKDDPSPECKGAWNDFWEVVEKEAGDRVKTWRLPVEEVKEMSYPFKFGYKNSGSRGSSNGAPSKPSIDDSDCEGGICEMSAERMARKNKFLFKKKYGGKISQEDVNKFKEKFGY